MIRRFEFDDGASHKFWEVSQDGAEITVRFGRIGAKPRTQVTNFADEAAAVTNAKRLIAEKTKKGYREVDPPAADAAEVASTPTAFDTPAIWKQILKTLKKLEPDNDDALPAGVGLDEIRRVEQAIQLEFPEAFRQAYLCHNGSNGRLVCPNAFFLPMSEPGDAPAGILEAWREMHFLENELPTEPVGPIRNVHFHPGWVPFADNNGGDYICLDLAPDAGGVSGQVIAWSHEVGPQRVLAPGFAEWFRGLPETLTAYHQATRERAQTEARNERLKHAAEGCWGAPKLTGKVFCFATKPGKWIEQLMERVTPEGGTIVEEPSPQVNYFVKEAKTSKVSAPEKKALQLNKKGAAIAVLDEAEFAALFSPTMDELVAVLRGRPTKERWEWLLGGIIPMPDCRDLDFRDLDLSGLDLQLRGGERGFVHWTGSDFRSANLNEAALRLDACNLDDATLIGATPWVMTNCSARRVNMSEARMNCANLDGSDLTAAILRDVAGPCWNARHANFQAADLAAGCLERCKFENTDFSTANLSFVSAGKTNFSGCNFTGADLTRAELSEAIFVGANLTQANFSRANLAGADLTGAVIRGANFTGANLSNAKVDSVDRASAASFPTERKEIGAAGPWVLQLAEVAAHTERLIIQLEAVLGRGTLYLQLEAGTFGATGSNTTRKIPGSVDGQWGFPRWCQTVPECMSYLAKKWIDTDLDLESMHVSANGCPLDHDGLQKLALAAFREAFGQ